MAKRASRLTALAVLMIGSIVPLQAWADETATNAAPAAQTKEPPSGAAPVATSSATAESGDAQVAARRRGQVFRVDLGLSLPSGAMGGAAAGLGAGPLGWTPVVETAFELHLTGPAWGFVRARGSYRTNEDCCSRSFVWGAGGDVGVRVEAPLFPWLDLGGHVAVGAGVDHSRIDWGSDFSQTWALDAAGVLGLSAHLRPIDVFGVRLSVDIVSVGHSRSSWEGTLAGTGYVQRADASSTYAQLTATPRFELTYTF